MAHNCVSGLVGLCFDYLAVKAEAEGGGGGGDREGVVSLWVRNSWSEFGGKETRAFSALTLPKISPVLVAWLLLG